MDWDRIAALGLMSPKAIEKSKSDALTQALFNLGGAFTAAGAPSRNPGGQPLDLAPVFANYQNAMQDSVKQGLMLKQLEIQEKERKRKEAEREKLAAGLMPMPKTVTSHVPTGNQLKVTDLSYQPKTDWRGHNMPPSGPGSKWNKLGYDGYNPSQTVLASETRPVTEEIETNPILKNLSPGMRHVVSTLSAGGLAKEALGPILTAALKPTTPYSTLGKLNADYRLGRITKEEFNAGRAKLTQLTQAPQPRNQREIMGPDGKNMGVRIWDQAANKGAGGFVVHQHEGGQVPYDIRIHTPVNPSIFGIGALKAKDLNILEDEIGAFEKSLRDLERYSRNQGGTDIGFQRIANTFTERLKVMLGKTNYTPEEISQRMAKGQLQGLLGQLRVETVGPGVMTEFDAQRVIARLGGDVNAWQNPKVVEGLIKEIFEDKQRAYTRAINQYNSQERYYDERSFTPIRQKKFELTSKYSREPVGGMKIGQEDNGYKYLGGPPGDPNSWEKMK